jgi:signal transduction histidine kinase/ActR/RegA family two-component response regulator
MQVPFLFLWPAVLFTAWYGGLRPGLLATLLSALVAGLWLLQPHFNFVLADPADLVALALFVPLGASLSLLTDRLHRARQLAEHADQYKDAFLAVLGHELRNSLAPLRNVLELLAQRGDDPTTVRWARDVAQRQVGIMSRLVGDLLDVSRVGRGKMRLQLGRLDLAALVRGATEDHRAALEQGHLTFEVQVPPGPIWVEGDAPRLVQVIGNLLRNAVKFTDPGGRVVLRMEVEGKLRRAVVQVRDTGIGIEPDMLGKVFESYAQAERSARRSGGGLGLGLALVKGLVELHGGKVEANSAGPGQGAEFTFWLPTVQAPPAAAPIAHRRALHKALKVVLIEDNRDAADSFRMLLEVCGGQEVKVAYSGRTGLELARTSRPDVILCDINLPDLDGLAVARAIRLDPALRDVRLVSMSGYSRDEDRKRCCEAGFDLTLTKPIDPAELGRLLAEPLETVATTNGLQPHSPQSH